MAEHNVKNAESEFVKHIIYCINSRQYAIINMDLDGIMCYAIAKIFQPNMEIAGYSDSATQVFKAKYAKIANTVCLDLYCKTKGLACIDNHIIDIVTRTIEEEFKHNPNIVRSKTLENYTEKYPFSTFILLCAVFDNIGWHGFNLDAVVCYYENQPIYLWELILRADDTLCTSRMNYIENAENWWEWLLSIAGEDGMLYKIYQKVMSFSKEQANEEKIRITKVLKKYFHTETDDGFLTLCGNYHIFNETILDAFRLGYEYPQPQNLTRHAFIKIVFKTSDRDLMDRIINDNDVFSYAFVAKDRLSVSITESSKPKFDKIKCTEKLYDFPLDEIEGIDTKHY